MWGLYLNFKLLVFEDIIVTFATFAQATQAEFLISMFDVMETLTKGTFKDESVRRVVQDLEEAAYQCAIKTKQINEERKELLKKLP